MKKNIKIVAMFLMFIMLFSTACSDQAVEETDEDVLDEAEVESEVQEEMEDETADVVVVGAGMGGLSAATEAARLGADVILLEKLSFPGGSSALCEGYIWSSGAEINMETGEGFDVDTMTNYLIDHNPGKVNEELIKNITSISAETLDTYMDEGLRINNDEFTYGDTYNGEVLMALTAPDEGTGMIQDLTEIAEDKGVDIRTSSPVTELLADGDAVNGVVVESEGGDYKINAGTVILASGGFANDDELMKEFAPTYAENRIVTGTVGATGDAHKMVLDLGGSMVGENMMGTYTLDEEPSYNMPEGEAAYSSRFVVNKEGERFQREFGESEEGKAFFLAVSEQAGSQGYAFFDSNFE